MSEAINDRLKEYKGQAKLGKRLRHEIVELFHALYDKALLVNLVDPNFEKELDVLGLTKAFDAVTSEREERRVERNKRQEGAR